MNLEKYDRIAIQAPDGLRGRAMELCEEFNSTGKEAFLLLDPCYGACDLRDREAKALGAEVLLHLGHADFGVESDIPVIFDPHYYEVQVGEESVCRICETLEGRSFSMCYPINFEKVAQSIREKLGTRSLNPVDFFPVLGCTFPEQGVETILYIGDGEFHPLGVSMKNSSVLSFDPFSGEVKNVNGEHYIRKRYAAIARGVDAERFGILVSTKKGQQNMGVARDIRERLERSGKSAVILAMDRINNENLIGCGVDVFINTACPRIALDDDFEKPMINHFDFDAFEEIS